VKFKGVNDQQRCGPFYPHTNPEVSACYPGFAVQQCAIIIVPSYKELVKTVNNVLKGHMLRKNQRKQMTNRCTQRFPVQQCAIIIVPSDKELVKTVNNVLKGHMLRKNPRKQMTNRDVPKGFQSNNMPLSVLLVIRN
jgi:3-deoxy-D-manno-octulosonic-acid transferase